MKIVGVFANLTLNTRDGVDLHTRQYVDASARLGVEWALILFSDSDQGTPEKTLPGPFTLVRSSKSFPVLALKTARDVMVWLVSGRKIGFLAQIAAEVERTRPDLIFIDGLPLAPLVFAFPRYRAVLTCVDAMSLRQARFMKLASGVAARLNYAIRAASCYVLEKLCLHKFAIVHVVSEVDAAYLRELSPRAHVRAIPVMSPVEPRELLPHKRRDKFVVWGDVAVPHVRAGIVKFFKEVPPLLGKDSPSFLLVGRRQPDAELQQILDASPMTEYSRWVPDLDDLLANATAVIMPDESGTGIKNRALHAMALGSPVIGTPAALEGTDVEDGKHALVCTSSAEFVSAIQRVLLDPRLVASMEQEAVCFVAKHYSKSVVSEQWLDLLREAAAH